MSDMNNLVCNFKKLSHAADLPLPSYESEAAAGMDLRAALSSSMVIEPGERVLIPTGLKMAIPMGFEAQIRPRSGLAWKHGITMLNTPGTIDSDYRGEVKVLAINHGEKLFTVAHGDRIAQMVIAPVSRATIRESDTLEQTERNEKGFGSTGVD